MTIFDCFGNAMNALCVGLYFFEEGVHVDCCKVLFVLFVLFLLFARFCLCSLGKFNSINWRMDFNVLFLRPGDWFFVG